MPLGRETVLLVDDEDMIHDVGVELLEKLGYEVLFARSGKEAIEMVRKATGAEYEVNEGQEQHTPGPVPHAPDLVILDMIMPNMSGGDTFDRLREIDPLAGRLRTGSSWPQYFTSAKFGWAAAVAVPLVIEAPEPSRSARPQLPARPPALPRFHRPVLLRA